MAENMDSAHDNAELSAAAPARKFTAERMDIRDLAKEALEIWDAADEAAGGDEVMEAIIGKIVARIHDIADDAVFISRSEARQICGRLEYDASWDKCGSGYYRLKRSLAQSDTPSRSTVDSHGID